VTKLFEEFARGTLGELVNYFSREPIRGEVTLMVHGKS
jgi:16S rRNA C1402 (ribose-2'-O) methylase RsmI